MPRVDRSEDPRLEAAALAEQVRLEQRHPAGVHLQLGAGIAVRDRHARRAAAEVELGEREAAERRILDHHAAPPKQLAGLRQPHGVREVAGYELTVSLARGPAIAARAPRCRLRG